MVSVLHLEHAHIRDIMVHWNCCSALCYNNFKTLDEKGQPLKYFKLPKDPKVQLEYKKIFKTSGINWKSGFICSAHWKNGIRGDENQLPDIPVPEAQYELIKLKYEKAKNTLRKTKEPTAKQKLAYNNAKKKLSAATALMQHHSSNNTTPSSKRRRLRSPIKERNIKSDSLCKTSSDNNQDESESEQVIKELKKQLLDKEMENAKLKEELENFRSTVFSYEVLSKNPKNVPYITGLSVEKFQIIFNCLYPYLHLIPYPSNRKVSEKLFSLPTQLMITLAICRHSLELKFMAFVLKTSETTVQRIFNGWVIFTATVFNRIDLHPEHGFLLKKMPDVFVTTGHGYTDLIIDATEFKFECATNYDLNALMFSNYKNTQTGKALIGISPHGMGIIFSDIYPGSISDSAITEKTNILDFVEEHHELMSDRGFAVQDLCATKGIFLNRPKQKYSDQFS